MEPNYLDIGKRLQEARKNANISQQELADMMEVSVSYIKNTERGSKPSIKYLFVVVESCHVSFDWILNGVQIPMDQPKEEDEVEKTLDTLRKLLNDSDPDIRAWAKVQIRKGFADYFSVEGEK
jgi:transcriptional regulator with XRE-family HTH domain